MQFITIDLNKFDFPPQDNKKTKHVVYKINYFIVRFSLNFNCKKLENF